MSASAPRRLAPAGASSTLGSPYLDYLIRQVDEVMETYPDGDGIFMDISFQLPSVEHLGPAGNGGARASTGPTPSID